MGNVGLIWKWCRAVLMISVGYLASGNCLAVSAWDEDTQNGGGASASDPSESANHLRLAGLSRFSPVSTSDNFGPSAKMYLPKQRVGALLDSEIDRVLVEKSAKKLYLMVNGKVYKEYPIALGKNPVGHKQEEGDGRTPEGEYVLDWRNPESKFYRSIHISYPNDADIAQAKSARRDPGKYIMIHGSPDWVPSAEWAKQWLNKEDWTDGCIAVSNDVMDEIWQLVAVGTPIEIKP